MIDEFVLVPDIFDRDAYSNPALIDAYLPQLKKPLLEEAIVRDLRDGEWSSFLERNYGNLHIKCKEILKKLQINNRLRRFPSQSNIIPTTPDEWCQESLLSHKKDVLTGIIAAHVTKQQFPQTEVASIEKLTGALWWQGRSPSTVVNRKTCDFLAALHRVLLQANSLMFIDPNLDPSSHNYRDFHRLLIPLKSRTVKPRIEIHRSLCKGDGSGRTFPTETEWKIAFRSLSDQLKNLELMAEVFFWDDFHDRYLITDIVGILVPGGFDITGKPDDPSTWGRIGRDDKDKWQSYYDPDVRPKKDLKWHFFIGAST